MAYPYMGTTCHFHVVFDVHVLDLNLSNTFCCRPVMEANVVIPWHYVQLNISWMMEYIIKSQYILFPFLAIELLLYIRKRNIN